MSAFGITLKKMCLSTGLSGTNVPLVVNLRRKTQTRKPIKLGAGVDHIDRPVVFDRTMKLSGRATIICCGFLIAPHSSRTYSKA